MSRPATIFVTRETTIAFSAKYCERRNYRVTCGQTFDIGANRFDCASNLVAEYDIEIDSTPQKATHDRDIVTANTSRGDFYKHLVRAERRSFNFANLQFWVVTRCIDKQSFQGYSSVGGFKVCRQILGDDLDGVRQSS
jgi:hypothetical protein